MAEKYNHPAIEEALFDLRIRGDQPCNEESFDKFLKKLTGYSKHIPLRNINVDITTMTQKPEIIAYRCISQDKKHIVQFRKDGFTFSRLKPYNSWNESYKEALDLWEKYCEIIKPIAITRVATRFINNFQIPLVFTKPEEYFNTHIQYDHSISPVWNQMFYRLLLSHNNIKSHIIFDSNVNQPTQNVNIIFDIDVFSDSFTLPYTNQSALGDIFSQLREIKNTIFEKSITDKIREIIK